MENRAAPPNFYSRFLWPKPEGGFKKKNASNPFPHLPFNPKKPPEDLR